MTPTLAIALDTPMAASVIKLLSKELTGNEHSSEAEIESALLNVAPEKLKQLQKIDNQYDEKMKALGITLQDLIVMQKPGSMTKIKNRLEDVTKILLVVILTIGFFGLLLIMTLDMQMLKEPALDIMLGALGSSWVQMISYYFSSRKMADVMNIK